MTHLTYPIRSTLLSQTMEVKRVVHEEETEFQFIEVLDTPVFGRILLLDGHIQLAELDEHAYHEALVHVPLWAVPQPKRALVVGGGDGGVLRELLKHPLERIDMVEIDARVVEVSRQHLQFLNQGAFEDPRVNLVVADAFEFVQKAEPGYDFVILDVTDVYEDEEGELSERIFTQGFYEDVLRLLSEGGIVVTQADNLLFCPYSLEAIQRDFEAVFPRVGRYWALVPSFGGYSGFCWASRGATPPSEWPGASLLLRYLNPVTYSLGLGKLPF